jgi:FkbM family methyltransferase
MLLNLKSIVNKYNIKVSGVLHIGAHFGEENGVYNDLGIQKRIFFEPLPSNFRILKNNIGENYTLMNIALGNENKKISMNVETANSGQSSSILNPLLHLIQYPHIKFETTEDVDMKRLDDLDIDLSGFNFINIDVQGYELEVFRGAKKTLHNIDYIMSEINRDEVYQNCARIEQLIDFLSPYGFELVEQTWDGGTWGDGFFIKNK